MRVFRASRVKTPPLTYRATRSRDSPDDRGAGASAGPDNAEEHDTPSPDRLFLEHLKLLSQGHSWFELIADDRAKPLRVSRPAAHDGRVTLTRGTWGAGCVHKKHLYPYRWAT